MNFFILDGLEKIGPLTMEDLRSKEVQPEDLVWFERLKYWQQASSVPELKELFFERQKAEKKNFHIVKPPPSPFEPQEEIKKTETLLAYSKLKIVKIMGGIGVAISLCLMYISFMVRNMSCGCVSREGVLTHYQMAPGFEANANIIFASAIFLMLFSLFAFFKISKRYKYDY